jgi:predicted nuclease of predicted toxin-antitoxin system
VKFLIDECLSPKLVKLAQDKGYGESTHVTWRKLAGKKDWELKPIILDGDWTFVTRNSVDFRGPSASPGSRGQYADVVIHAGLTCLNGPEGMKVDVQLELFGQALEDLAAEGDLINQVLEITLEENQELRILRYSLPPTTYIHLS